MFTDSKTGMLKTKVALSVLYGDGFVVLNIMEKKKMEMFNIKLFKKVVEVIIIGRI